jgi:hypothetical protein
LYVCVLLLWGLVVISRLRYNGTVFGFDYGLYQPDGAHYTFRTLTFLGLDDKSAAKQVASWYELHGINHNLFSFQRLIPETNPVWNLSAPRVIYPLLSMPFVYAFGVPGMLAVPAISLLTFCLIVMRIGFKANRGVQAFILVALLLSSSSITRWMVSNITDGLLVLFCSLMLLLLESRSRLLIWSLATCLIVISASLTRFSFPIWFFIGIYLVKVSQIHRAISVFVSSLIGLVPILFYSPLDGITGVQSNSNIGKILMGFTLNSFKVLIYEVGQLFVLDRVLFILLVVSFVYMIKSPRSNDVLLYFAVILGCVMLGSINGVVGVNFRYYLPLLPFLANLLVRAEWAIFLVPKTKKYISN